jgi:hypothetical protein
LVRDCIGVSANLDLLGGKLKRATPAGGKDRFGGESRHRFIVDWLPSRSTACGAPHPAMSSSGGGINFEERSYYNEEMEVCCQRPPTSQCLNFTRTAVVCTDKGGTRSLHHLYTPHSLHVLLCPFDSLRLPSYSARNSKFSKKQQRNSAMAAAGGQVDLQLIPMSPEEAHANMMQFGGPASHSGSWGEGNDSVSQPVPLKNCGVEVDLMCHSEEQPMTDFGQLATRLFPHSCSSTRCANAFPLVSNRRLF